MTPSPGGGTRRRVKRGHLLAIAAPFALLVPLGACGLTADFSGLQGGTAHDAATLTDASAGDAGTPPTPDAGFCASLSPQPRFCADFDQGHPLGTGFTITDLTAGATAKVDTVAYSPPGSFLSAFSADTPAPVSSRLQQSIPILARRVHIEFQMLIDPSAGSFELCVIHQTTSDGVTYGLFYKEDNDGKLVAYLKTLGADGGLIQKNDIIGAPPSTWIHVEMDIVVDDAGSYTVKHNGFVVAAQPSVSTSTQARMDMYVDFGFYSPKSGAAHAHFDNIVVDWE